MDTGMGHALGDGIIVASLAAALIAYLYFRHLERVRRLEILHQERVAAMEKGIPLPELPLEPPLGSRGPDLRTTLVHGIVWTTLSAGAMLAMIIIGVPDGQVALWPLPLPLLFLGIGLMLYYALAARRAR